MLVAVLGIVFFGVLEASSSYSSYSGSSDTRHHAMAKKAAGCSKHRPCKMPPRQKRCHREPSCRSPAHSYSCSDSNSCSYKSSCSKGSDSCSMSVSWEESQVHAEIVRQRVKNPKHRLYIRPACSSSSKSSTCKSVSCPTEYTTIELIRPHVARHHKRHIRVKEEVCPLSTEVEIIRKKHCPPCKKEKCKKKTRYEVVCKPYKKPCKPCHKPCEKKCQKKPTCRKTKNCNRRH